MVLAAVAVDVFVLQARSGAGGHQLARPVDLTTPESMPSQCLRSEPGQLAAAFDDMLEFDVQAEEGARFLHLSLR